MAVDAIDTLKQPLPVRILIIEDDLSLRPFWEWILKSAVTHVAIDWVVTVNSAEALLKKSFAGRRLYDLIIADVFLAGGKTGIELWNHFGEVSGKFIFVSAEPMASVKAQVSLALGHPIFLQKPLSATNCLRLIKSLLPT